MNGPEHYREAERLLTAAVDGDTGQAALIARAAVHAQLAQVAAAVDISLGIRDGSTFGDWLTVRLAAPAEEASPR